MAPALTLTYDDSLSYVLCSATGLTSTADVALFEVSTDQVSWSTVRGGSAVSITSGAAAIRDYEFAAGVRNYYRVAAIDTSAAQFIASSTAVTANNASVSPTVPAGYAEGDLLVAWAAIRNSGAGAIVVPSGWTAMLQTDNIALLGKRASASEGAPTIAITGGVAGADVIAQMACFRNLELTPAATAYQFNPSAQNIALPPLPAVQSAWSTTVQLGWKQNGAATSVAALSGATEIGEPKSVLGNGAMLVWDYTIQATPAAVIADAFVVTGGSAAINYGAAAALRLADYVTRTTASIVPNMTATWLKIPEAPYLNRKVIFIGWTDQLRTARTSTYTVLSKLHAGAYLNVAAPYTCTIHLWAETDDEVRALDLTLALAGVVYLHVPPTCAFKTLYAVVGTYRYEKPAHRSHKADFTVPLTEVDPPDIAVVGNTVTWATLINRYGSWQDVVNANATWNDVLALIGTLDDALLEIS